MEDPAEELIRRALARRPPPSLGPTFADDVLRTVAVAERALQRGGSRARRRLAAAIWLLAAAASVAVLANLPWSGTSRALAWLFGLVLVPVAYSATLWPRRFLGVLALCGGSVLRERGTAR